MPQAYLMALSAGSSLDQQSNNVSLFNLVEQVNVPPGAPPPPNNQIPLEVHCYFHVEAEHLGKEVELRFALTGATGLESFTAPVRHRVATSRFRMRSIGVPFPPALGHYELRVDFRIDEGPWERDALSYPLSFLQTQERPAVTH